MADAADLRHRVENAAPVRARGAYVLHWMVEARRTRWNRALARSVELARSLHRPLLVLEAFRSDTRYASARFHRFVLDGMADQAARFEAAGVAYYPYVEPDPGSGRGLLTALAADACVVVTDASPLPLHARMRAAAARRLDVRLEAVDGSGLLPRAAVKDALDDLAAFRARFRRALPPLAFAGVEEDPLAHPPPRQLEKLPAGPTARWHPVRKALLDGDPELLARVRVDASVAPSPLRGGEGAARAALAAALAAPADRFAPGLEPWVRFGHLSTEEVARALLLREGRIPSVDLRREATEPDGWWVATRAVDGFLDRLVLRREHALHRAERRGRDLDRWELLPAPLRGRLEQAGAVPGRAVADAAALEAGQGPDPAFAPLAAALRAEGRLADGARGRWARAVLEATAHPRDAFDLAVHLTHKWALDGRDPAAVAEVAAAFEAAVAAPPAARPRPGPEGRARGPRRARDGGAPRGDGPPRPGPGGPDGRGRRR